METFMTRRPPATTSAPNRRTVLKTGLAAGALAVPGVGLGLRPALAADGVVKIGFVGPVTGTFAELGTAMRDGAQVAVDDINAAGGVTIGDKTYEIDLVIGDEEATPERAIAATRRLIEVDGVMGILGYANSTNLLATMPLLQDSRVPMIAPPGALIITPAVPKTPPARVIAALVSNPCSLSSCRGLTGSDLDSFQSLTASPTPLSSTVASFM